MAADARRSWNLKPEIGMQQEILETAKLVKAARRVLFMTGAGVSAESGVPTFRGATGAFADGLTEEGIPFEDVLSGSTFACNPKLSWKYFHLLERSIRGKEPNAAHRAISKLDDAGRVVWVATQNIDGLHQSAGSRNVIELHGNLRRLICTKCDYTDYRLTFEGMPDLPRCPKCEALLRPDAVLYEEMLPEEALETLDLEQQKGFDVVFSVGTTSVFSYVTSPIIMACRRGIPTVEINPEPTPISDLVSYRFAAPAGKTLGSLLEAMVRDA
jgi:NAD-dependent deacetylase